MRTLIVAAVFALLSGLGLDRRRDGQGRPAGTAAPTTAPSIGLHAALGQCAAEVRGRAIASV